MEKFRNSNQLLKELKDYLKEYYLYNFESIMIPENFKNLLSLTLQIEKIKSPCIFPLYFPVEKAKKLNPPPFEVHYYEALNYIVSFEYMALAQSYACLAHNSLKEGDLKRAKLFSSLQVENLGTVRTILFNYISKWEESER